MNLSDIRLQFPITTLSNKILMPAGTLFDAETMERLRANNRNGAKYTLTPLIYHDHLLADLLHLVECSNHYKLIFSNPEQVAELIKILAKIELPAPVTAYLDFFKLNDFYTYRHILLVFALSSLLAIDLIHDHDAIIQEAIASPTHDFGKISIPLDILTKESPLTDREYQYLKHHTLAGYALLTNYFPEKLQLPALVALQHHERCNGTGYPCGISIKDIMVEIVLACDVYDALISPRPYRPVCYSNRSALETLTAMAQNSELSWDVVKALVAKNRKNQPYFKECEVSSEKREAEPENNAYGQTIKDC